MLWNATVAPTQSELLGAYRANFFQRVEEGSLKPIVLPHDLYGLALLIAYLLIPHHNRPWLYKARWLVLAVIVAFEAKVIATTSSKAVAGGFGAGLSAMYVALWSVMWLVLKDPQREAQRIERRRKRKDANGTIPTPLKSTSNGHANGHANGHKVSGDDSGIRQRHLDCANASKHSPNATTDEEQWEYFWQPYPEDSFMTRFSWVWDLIMNCRGPGWNWEISTMPGPPAHIKASLGEEVDARSQLLISSNGVRAFKTRTCLLRYRVLQYLMYYIFLDILKITVKADPWFLLGPNAYPLPKHLTYLPPSLVPLVRQFITLLSIIVALQVFFATGPTILSLFLGPAVLGLRGEAHYYPTTWGASHNVTQKGLAGFWGGWWHQTFRALFQAPTQYLIKHGYLTPNSPFKHLSYLFFAFLISGLLHAAGSYTTMPETIPWHPPLFFLLQVVGISFQTLLCRALKPWIEKHVSAPVRAAGNVAFTAVWLHLTCQILLDDFARSGIWMYEPIPVSLLTAMGWGNAGGKVVPWWEGEGGQSQFWWYRAPGGRWWESGWAY